MLQLQFRYLRGQERRRSHLRQGGAQEESRSFEREEKRVHLRRLPDGGEDEEVTRRRHETKIELKLQLTSTWTGNNRIGCIRSLGCFRAQRRT